MSFCSCIHTEIIKVCINAIWSSHRADKTGFQVRAPSIHQHSLSSLVILRDRGKYRMWMQCFGFGSCPETFLQHLNSHRTDSANTSIYSFVPSLSIRLSLSEEEVNFIIICVIIVSNNCWSHKFGFCRKKNCLQRLGLKHEDRQQTKTDSGRSNSNYWNKRKMYACWKLFVLN